MDKQTIVLQELETEFDNLMRSGLDELAVEDSELAEENFSLAATVLDRVKELSLPMAVALENRYLVNPYDYQQKTKVKTNERENN